MKKYIPYALGEILLVMIGILLALQVNNWNENRKTRKHLAEIYEIIHEDLVVDTLQIAEVQEYYAERRPTIRMVLTNTMTQEAYDTCVICCVLVSTFYPMSLNEKGYRLLQEFSGISAQKKDTLITTINYFYNSLNYNIDRNQKLIEEDILRNIEDWKEKYDWFYGLTIGQSTEQYYHYLLNDPDYKNRVALHSTYVYANLLPDLEEYQDNAREIINIIEKRQK